MSRAGLAVTARTAQHCADRDPWGSRGSHVAEIVATLLLLLPPPGRLFWGRASSCVSSSRPGLAGCVPAEGCGHRGGAWKLAPVPWRRAGGEDGTEQPGGGGVCAVLGVGRRGLSGLLSCLVLMVVPPAHRK